MSLVESMGLSMAQALPAEAGHKLTIQALKSGLVKPAMQAEDPILATSLPISGLVLKNPIGLAAGFDKNAEVFGAMLGYGFGLVECGTVTPRPQPGNPKPRLFRLEEDGAVINRMGFNNQGMAAFVRRLSAGKEDPRAEFGVVGANVGANKVSEGSARIADYVAGVNAVWPYCSYVTINISSPNTPGLRGLQEKGALEELLGGVAEAACRLKSNVGSRPIFLKIAPDVDEEAVGDIVETVLKAGELTGIIATNTTIERPETLKAEHRSQSGGLSGAPVFEKSTQVLKWVAQAADGRLDIIGAGGVCDAKTAYAKLEAGAHAVQLYSALAYRGPSLVKDIKTGLIERLKAEGKSCVGEIGK